MHAYSGDQGICSQVYVKILVAIDSLTMPKTHTSIEDEEHRQFGISIDQYVCKFLRRELGRLL